VLEGVVDLREKRWSAMATGDLKKMTKAELMKMARAMKLEVKGGMLKAELVGLISRNASRRGKRGASAKARVGKKKTTAAKVKRTGRKVKSKKTGRTAKAASKSRPARPKTKRAAKKAARSASPKRKKPKPAAMRTGARPAPRAMPPRGPAARERRLDAETIRQKAEAGKYYLGVEEKAIPPVESLDIPSDYNTDRILAMVRDPHWIFAYWEVTDERYRALHKEFADDWDRCRTILRVYDRSDLGGGHFDIELSAGASNWYIHVTPDRRYQISIGILAPDGTFTEIAASNTVETPRTGVSDVIDDRWMIPDELFDLVFAASGGYDLHATSAELRELVERRLLEQVGSGAVSSFGSGALRAAEKERGFRLWVATELILYGATEPDARLTIQGKETKVRGDGTFSIRLALPDGKIDIPVTAVSADSIEERTVDTSVSKKSKRKEPVIR
jgi:hypothetical protein